MLKNLVNSLSEDAFLLGFAAVMTLVYIGTGFIISTTIDLFR